MANRVRNIVLRVPVTAQEREMIELKMEPDPEKEVDYAFVEKVRFIGNLIQYNYYVSHKAGGQVLFENEKTE